MSLNEIIKKFQDGNKKLAYNLIKSYIKENPKDLIALYNYAYMSELLNFQEEAIKNYNLVKAKDKNNWKSRFNLYLLYIKKNEHEKAIKLINEVLNIKPNYQPALRDRALSNYNLGKYADALKDIILSIKLNNKDYIALNILGIIYGALNDHLKAKEIFFKAIELNSNYAPSYNNLGNCLLSLGEVNASLENCEKALKLNKNFEEAINNIANILIIKGKYSEAIKYYNRALKQGGNKATILYNLGVANNHLRNFKKAEEYYNRSFAINPNDEILKKNYAILYLAKQDYKKAWEYYDGRLHLSDFVQKNKNITLTKNKVWKGEKLSKNQKILIIKEQGIGDEIVFSSMYPDILKTFPNCKIETEIRLLSLFKRSFNKKENFIPYLEVSNNKKKLNTYDKVIYAGSLGRMFRNSINDFPKKPFLCADINKINEVKSDLNSISAKPKIGITWESKRKIYGEDKSISLNLLKPILRLKNFTRIKDVFGI